jgi:glycosyltransferase involved in cell wall biosynthesis
VSERPGRGSRFHSLLTPPNSLLALCCQPNPRTAAIDTPSPVAERPRLSACIIAFNEADRIGDCIASLAFCDEVVVVDSYSSDATAAIAQAAGARVLQRAFDGFRSQKHYAVEQAAHDWVLCLDADERVDARLRASIEAARTRGFGDAAGYRFARLSEYFGKFLRHGNAYPDRVLRLFDRRRGGWRGQREIHEAASVDGAVATLDGDLIHYPYRSLEQQLSKTERYARMMAEHEYARGKRASLAKLVLAPAWRFWRGYLLRGGFLDGWHGLVYAYVRANYVRQKTIMLWMLERGQPLTTPPRRDDDATPRG